MKILILEDQGEETPDLLRCFQHGGHAVDTASVHCDTLALCSAGGYDVVCLEINLADAKGFNVIRQLKAQADPPTVIITSAKTSADAIAKGLTLGADDYITLPFSHSEVNMRVRIRADARRIQHGRSFTPQATTSNIGELVIDNLSRQIRRGAGVIDLTAREFALMECLVRNQGHPVGRRMLFESVWGESADPQTNVVEALICRLRKKFISKFRKQVVLTRHNGYILDTASQPEHSLPKEPRVSLAARQRCGQSCSRRLKPIPAKNRAPAESSSLAKS